jgi:hypothetical protein
LGGTPEGIDSSVTAQSAGGVDEVTPEIDSELTFYFEVIDTTGPSTEPVDVSASGVTSAIGPYASAAASFTMFYTPGLEDGACSATGGAIGTIPIECEPSVSPSSFATDEEISVPVNTQIEVEIGTECGPTTGSCSATVDPLLALDPSADSGASLIFSTGNFGSPAPATAPEPASLLLLCTGVLSLGTMVLRRKRIA